MLLDSSGLLCLLNESQPFHELATEVYENAHLRLTHS
jgi:hypothetical protein